MLWVNVAPGSPADQDLQKYLRPLRIHNSQTFIVYNQCLWLVLKLKPRPKTSSPTLIPLLWVVFSHKNPEEILLMEEIQHNLGYLPYQLVQDFFHQQYEGSLRWFGASTINPPLTWRHFWRTQVCGFLAPGHLEDPSLRAGDFSCLWSLDDEKCLRCL